MHIQSIEFYVLQIREYTYNYGDSAEIREEQSTSVSFTVEYKVRIVRTCDNRLQ